MGLIHGAQADALVLCHEANRPHMRGLPSYQLPPLDTCMALNLEAAKLTNPAARFIGVAVNTSPLPEAERDSYLQQISTQLGLPAVDPMITGVSALVDNL